MVAHSSAEEDHMLGSIATAGCAAQSCMCCCIATLLIRHKDKLAHKTLGLLLIYRSERGAQSERPY